MDFSTRLKVKRNPTTGAYSETLIRVNQIKELSKFLPYDDQIREWATAVIMGKTYDKINIKLKEDIFDEIIKKMYFLCGKRIEKYQSGVWKIPMKKGSYFYETINKIVLKSEKLRTDIIVITFKENKDG